MSRYIEHWLSHSRVIAALAVVLTLLSLTNLAHAVPRDPTAVPTAVAVGQTVTCQPTSTTRPQPTLPKGFTEQILYRGCLNQPTAISFNGTKSVFVAEKGGKVWDCDLSKPTCTLFADLGSEVCNDSDRGLLGLAVDPQNDGNVYVLYTTPPPAPGACSGNVLTHGQLSLLTRTTTGTSERKILPPEGSSSQPWCFFYQSHSIGNLAFGADNRTLYVSAGDGASFTQVDFGQLDNACGDGTNFPQGAFRSQGVSPYSDGVILRITNPGTTTQRVDTVAQGFRNPFRFARVPGTDDLYVGNVGWNTWEAIDHVSVAGQNFGWPCYEGWDPNNKFGAAPQPDYQNTGYCGSVGGVTAPFFAYAHQSYVTPEDSKGRTCGGKPSRGGPDQNDRKPSHGGPDQNGSVISAIGFTDDTSATYPAQFKNALYFGDLLRQCIWTMQPANEVPMPHTFAKGLEGGPVDLKAGPSGDLFYVDIVTGTVRQITHK